MMRTKIMPRKMRRMKMTKKKLKTYEVEMDVKYYATENATFQVQAESKEHAEEVAIAETENGGHIRTHAQDWSGYEGLDGYGYDNDYEVISVRGIGFNADEEDEDD